MSLIDSVNKLFIVKHRHGAMHFEGCKDELAAIEMLARHALSMLDKTQADATVLAIRARVNRVIADRRRDDRNDRRIEKRRAAKAGTP